MMAFMDALAGFVVGYYWEDISNLAAIYQQRRLAEFRQLTEARRLVDPLGDDVS